MTLGIGLTVTRNVPKRVKSNFPQHLDLILPDRFRSKKFYALAFGQILSTSPRDLVSQGGDCARSTSLPCALCPKEEANTQRKSVTAGGKRRAVFEENGFKFEFGTRCGLEATAIQEFVVLANAK
jgi:hypothetical protein